MGAARSGVGTWAFMAPEITGIKLKWDGFSKVYGVKADIWSLGVVIYRLLSGGKTPFGAQPNSTNKTPAGFIVPSTPTAMLVEWWRL